MATPFDYIDAVLYGKHDPDKLEFGSAYNPFLMNRALAMHPDTVFIAVLLDRIPASFLPKHKHWEAVRGAVPKIKRRWKKWPKSLTLADDDTVEAVAKFYDVSLSEARAAIQILPDGEAERIKKEMSRGTEHQVCKIQRGEASDVTCAAESDSGGRTCDELW